VAHGARNDFWRGLKVLRRWRQAQRVAALKQQLSLVPDEERTVVGQRALGRKFREIGSRTFAPVVPGEPQSRTLPARRKLIADNRPPGRGLLIHARRLGLYGRRRAQVEPPESRVDDVAAHVPESPRAKIPPTAPFERVISR